MLKREQLRAHTFVKLGELSSRQPARLWKVQTSHQGMLKL